jgi:hypothetical protein
MHNKQKSGLKNNCVLPKHCPIACYPNDHKKNLNVAIEVSYKIPTKPSQAKPIKP